MVKVTSLEDQLTSALAQVTNEVALVTSLVSKSNDLWVARLRFGFAQVTYQVVHLLVVAIKAPCDHCSDSNDVPR